MTSILLALPWAGIIAFLLLIVKPVRWLTNITSLDPERAPSVGVIIPARNEAKDIEECLASLTKSRYLNFEIIVVDDRSEDGTAELARTVPAGNVEQLVVIDGEALLIWSALVCGLSVGIHAFFLNFLSAPVYYAVFYPLGSFMVIYIMIRSRIRAVDVEWKGRRYKVSN